jgi:hypothetical protein
MAQPTTAHTPNTNWKAFFTALLRALSAACV